MLTSEPTQIYAGSTIQWQKALPDYPPEFGWKLRYSFKNGEQSINFDATSSDDSSDFLISVSAADSAQWQPGRYQLVAWTELDDEKHIVVTGNIQILPNFSDDQPADNRSHNRKVLDSINAILEGREDVTEYVIAGYQLRTMPIADLLHWQQVYAHRVLKEEGKLPKFHGARFDGSSWYPSGGNWSSH